MPILAFKMPARVASRSRGTTKGRGGRKGGPDRRRSGPERKRVLKPQNYKVSPAVGASRVAVAGARTPQALALLVAFGLGFAIGEGLRRLLMNWGRENNPQRFTLAFAKEAEFTSTSPATYRLKWQRFREIPATFLCSTGQQNSAATTDLDNFDLSFSGLYGFRYQFTDRQDSKTCSAADGSINNQPWVEIQRQTAVGGAWTTAYVLTTADGTWGTDSGVRYTNKKTVGAPTSLTKNGVALELPTTGTLPPRTTPIDEPVTAEATPTAALVAIQPSVSPVLPDAEPVLQPEVAPEESNFIETYSNTLIRSTSTVPLPQYFPDAIQVENGTLAAPTLSPVQQTSPDAIYPIPGGPALTGNGPRADLGEMAKELGRIERKLELMLNPEPAANGDWTDRLQLLAQLLKSIYDALTDGAEEGSYQLTSPCEVDSDGNRLIYEATWPTKGTNHEAILSRVDAIASLLQIHKDLKQPNCRGADVPVGGEFVTVNFEQID